MRTRRMRSTAPWRYPLTGYEPNQLDNFDYSRNSTMSLSEKRYLHHCSLRIQKNLRTRDKRITLMKKVCCQLSPFPCTNQVQICLKNGNQVATWNTSEPRLSLKEKKSKFLLKSDLRSRSTNFKPSRTKEVSRN